MEFFKTIRFRCALAALALAFFCWMPAYAQAESADDDANNKALDFTLILPEGNPGRQDYVSDGNAGSCVRVGFGGVMELLLPEGAKHIYLTWQSIPTEALLSFFDAKGVKTGGFSVDKALYHQCYAVPAGSKSATLSSDKSDVALSEIRVYAALPADILLPEAPTHKTDVLLVAAHTGDESYYFGGLLPILAGEKNYTVTVVFLSSGGRVAEEEAMRALHASGVKAQPFFAGFAYRLRPSGQGAYPENIWDQNRVKVYLGDLIRRCQPEIVITHDVAGEDGDSMHANAAALARLGIAAAGEDGGEKDAWQVGRLYEHKQFGGDILLPVDSALPSFDGSSAREIAQQGYDGYSGLAVYHKTLFAADAAGYSLVEEYRKPDQDPMLDLVIDPMPSPVPSPTPSPAPTATVEPEPEKAHTIARLAVGIGSFSRRYAAVIACIGALLSVLLLIWLLLRRKERKLLPLLFCMIPLVLGLFFAFAMSAIGDAAKALLPLAPEPTATPAITASPTAPPTPTPNPADAYFRQEGEPEEFVLFDSENDHYIYRSDTLSVEIQRYDTVSENNRPLRYYVAHVRARGENPFRPGFASYRENGRDPGDPFALSRRVKAVLAITGDNMTHSDEKNKAVILRAGRKYLDNRSGSTMVLSPDGMGMFICYGQTTGAQQLLDMGVMNTYSFGPELIVDGQLNANADAHYLAKYNPRVGLGLVEDGHFVVIVVEGRVSKYSYGVRLGEFADLFMQEGCIQAYNLDGGASSCLLFMGEYVNKRMPNQYRDIPDLLMWGYSDLVPGENEPAKNSGFYSG